MSTKLTVAGTMRSEWNRSGQHGQPGIGHPDHADVRLDGGERVVGREHVVARQGVEQRRLARVGEPTMPMVRATGDQPRASMVKKGLDRPGQRRGVLGPASSRAGVHGQQREADVDGADAQPGGGQRTDGRSAGHGVVRHEFLGRHAGGPAGAPPQRRTQGVGRVPLIGVDLEQRPAVEQRVVGRIVSLRVVRVDRVTGVDREAPGARTGPGAGHRGRPRGRPRSG